MWRLRFGMLTFVMRLKVYMIVPTTKEPISVVAFRKEQDLEGIFKVGWCQAYKAMKRSLEQEVVEKLFMPPESWRSVSRIVQHQ